LRDDKRRSGADVALIVSQALPKHVEQFDLVEGVWVAHPRCALPVAVALRQGLIDVSSSRLVQQGQQTKMEQVYHYLTGTKFRQRIDAVVEKFNDMREDLDKERKFMGRQWAKGEIQILSVLDSTVGMVGDLQAIAGKAMPEIPSLNQTGRAVVHRFATSAGATAMSALPRSTDIFSLIAQARKVHCDCSLRNST